MASEARMIVISGEHFVAETAGHWEAIIASAAPHPARARTLRPCCHAGRLPSSTTLGGKTRFSSAVNLTPTADSRPTSLRIAGAPPEPHAKFVQIDQRATAGLMNYMIMIGFGCKRVGWLYGRWVEDPATGEVGAQVHAIYEPSQDCTPDDLLVNADAEAEEKLAKLCAMLNLVRVGVIIAHPAREYPFSVNELIYASKLASQAREAAPEEGKRFVLMKARPVLESETDIEGVATVEAYQLTDQCIELVEREVTPWSRATFVRATHRRTVVLPPALGPDRMLELETERSDEPHGECEPSTKVLPPALAPGLMLEMETERSDDPHWESKPSANF